MRNYVIEHSLSHGSFGTVFAGKHKRTGETVVIKMEPLNATVSLLVREAKVYQYLGKQPFFPHMKYYGVTDTHRYLVMNHAGISLANVSELSHETVKWIAGQLLKCVQALHDMHLVHRDIKPANVLIKNKRVCLADFGFAKQTPAVEKTIHSIVGSPNFVSLNVHALVEPTMRDDVESCIYLCMLLLDGCLPWNNLELSQLYQTKQLTTNGALQYIRQLEFKDTPNYEYVRNLICMPLVT